MEGFALCADPLGGGGKIFAVLRAYIDESGTHEDAEVCCIAGYFGGVHQWSKFERDWKQVIERENLQEFHAKRFWKRDDKGDRVGEYRGWSDERAIRFLSDLLKIINTYRIYPFAAVIDVREWRKLSHNQRRWLTGAKTDKGRFVDSGSPSKSYFVPFQYCVLRPTWYCEPHIQVHFIADENKNIAGWAPKLFGSLRMIPGGHLLGSFSFADSRKACPLQAADLLAYEMYQYARRKVENAKARPRRLLGAMIRKAREPRHDFKLMDKAFLEFCLKAGAQSFGKPSQKEAENEETRY